jgi:hypothetical protein
MAKPIQNEAQAGPLPNVLHDQNTPNTLGGIGAPTVAARLRVSAGMVVAAVVVIVVVLAILAGRPF